MDHFSVCNDAVNVLVQRSDEEAELKGEGLDLLVDQRLHLTSGQELWVETQRLRSQI